MIFLTTFYSVGHLKFEMYNNAALTDYTCQGDAEYLRYHGMQEFDRAMQHLEDTYGVSYLCRDIKLYFSCRGPDKNKRIQK